MREERKRHHPLGMHLLPTALKHRSLDFSRAEAQEVQSRGAHGNNICVSSVGAWHGGDLL